MSFGTKRSKGTVNFNVDTSNFTFKSLKDLEVGSIYKFDGLYINTKSKFGSHPVAIVSDDEMLVDLPKHLTDEVKDILADADDVADIKAGKCGFRVYEYTTDDGLTCRSINWMDI